MSTIFDTRQTENKTIALPRIGAPINTTLDVILSDIDAILANLSGSAGGFTSTPTAAGTTTLTASSGYTQQFTGTTTQIIVLPAANTLTIGREFFVANRSTGIVTVNANGGGLLQTLSPGTQAIFEVINISSGPGVWDIAYLVSNAGYLTGTTLNSTVVSSSLTSVGTITTGVWNGTTIAVTSGGTGQSSALTQWGAIYSASGTAMASTAAGTTGQVLTATTGSAPTWTTLPAAAAGTLTGTTLNSTVVNSSLTSVGTIATGVWNGTVIGVAYQTLPTNNRGTVTTAVTIPWAASNVFTITLTSGNTCVVTFTGATSGQVIVVEVTNGSAGGTGAVTWPTVKWSGGIVPGMTIGTAALDVYTFVYNGSYYVGSVVPNMS
jgi:uncharacterized membrane protein YiaA